MAPFIDSSITPSSPKSEEPRDRSASFANERDRERTPRWCLPEIAGHLVEVCGGRASAALSLAFRLVHDAQSRGESAAWISLRKSSFFPPDVEECGIDLESFAVVRVPAAKEATFAADLLARSGAFGLIVLDLDRRSSVSMAVLSRLLGLARKHETAIVFLTEKPEDHASLGSLVAVRADARRTRQPLRAHESQSEREPLRAREQPSKPIPPCSHESRSQRQSLRAENSISEPLGADRFACELRVTKDKRRAFGWSHVEVRRGPDGMR